MRTFLPKHKFPYFAAFLAALVLAVFSGFLASILSAPAFLYAPIVLGTFIVALAGISVWLFLRPKAPVENTELVENNKAFQQLLEAAKEKNTQQIEQLLEANNYSEQQRVDALVEAVTLHGTCDGAAQGKSWVAMLCLIKSFADVTLPSDKYIHTTFAVINKVLSTPKPDDSTFEAMSRYQLERARKVQVMARNNKAQFTPLVDLLERFASNGKTAFSSIVGSGNMSACQTLLMLGVSPNIYVQENKKSLTPLHQAIELGNTDSINSLLLFGADVNQRAGSNGALPLTNAIKKGLNPVVDLLLEFGADVKQKTFYLNSAVLHYAAVRVNPGALRVLIARGADPELRNDKGNRPLYLTAGHVDSVAALLQGGASLDERNQGGETLYHLLARDHQPIGRLIGVAGLDQPAPAGAQSSARGCEDDPDMINTTTFPTRKPRHIEVTDAAGRTPLLVAVLSHGACTSVCRHRPATLKHKYDAGETVQALLRCHADLHASDPQNNNVLHYLTKWRVGEVPTGVVRAAVQNHLIQLAEFLIAQGADVTQRNAEGQTPAERAQALGYTKLAEVLTQPHLEERKVITHSRSNSSNASSSSRSVGRISTNNAPRFCA